MTAQEDFGPKRIVCLTEETVETLYLLGEQDRIAGISGFALRPPQARKEKPVVSVFTDASFDKIMALEPDLVIGFSDIQANIARELIARGITVWVNNYRTVEGIFNMIMQVGSLVGKQEQARSLVGGYRQHISTIQEAAGRFPRRPKVYFEEWFDPLISGITWVSELIELAGGTDIYKEFQHCPLAKDRIIADPADVVRRNPDIIIASWCGKAFKKQKLTGREGWSQINAVQQDAIYEIRSPVILQPGPAALTEGLQQIAAILQQWQLKQESLPTPSTQLTPSHGS